LKNCLKSANPDNSSFDHRDSAMNPWPGPLSAIIGAFPLTKHQLFDGKRQPAGSNPRFWGSLDQITQENNLVFFLLHFIEQSF
jgi:hypothetical protein